MGGGGGCNGNSLQREPEGKECLGLTHEVPECGLIMGHQVIDDGSPTESKAIRPHRYVSVIIHQC
jgi:hypothetical protein